MPINFKGITTTGGRAYDDKMILRLNDSLSEIPLKQRAAILGSIIEESGGNPLAKSENGIYQGLLQWGDDRYRIKSNDREKELVNQLNLIRNTIDNVTDKKSWTHGGEGSGYQRLTDAHNAFADTTNTLPDIFRGFSFGYVRPKGKEASYNNRLKVAQQVLDRLEAAESVSPKTTVSVEHVEVPDAINAFRPDNVHKPSLGNILTALDVKKSLYNLDKKLSWENQPASLHFVPSGQKDYTAHGEGGSLKTKKWEELSIPEKAEMMRVAIRNGITDLPTIKAKYNEFAGGGDIEQDSLPPIVPFKQSLEVVITPDSEYNRYLNTLPDNQRFTPNDKYDSYLYWKLHDKPKNFKEAYQKRMFHYDNSDKSYHANSIAWGDDGIGYFMKPKDHGTVGYELDWFNKGLVTEEGGYQRPETPEEKAESDVFRKNYELVTDPDRPNYYRYQLKKKKSLGGSFAEGGDMPTRVPVVPEEAQAPYNFVKNYVASDAFKRRADAVSSTYYKDHNDAMEHVRIFNTRGIYDSTVDKPFTIDDYNDYCWGKGLA